MVCSIIHFYVLLERILHIVCNTINTCLNQLSFLRTDRAILIKLSYFIRFLLFRALKVRTLATNIISIIKLWRHDIIND